MTRRGAMAALLAAAAAAPRPLHAHGGNRHEAAAGPSARLPVLGPAADFALEDQDGRPVTLRGLRGRVVVVAFLYLGCAEICPLLTQRLMELRDAVRPRLGGRVAFLCVTVDPGRDTREALRARAEALGLEEAADWHFLRGPLPATDAMARAYGVAVRRRPDGEVDHTTLTSLVDPRGRLRVQYLGTRFATAEFAADIAGLAARP